jgi:hypothetical protein
MAGGQDWCLQCGAGAPGSLGAPGWRSAAGIAGIVALLVLGAAAAGYAALEKGPRKANVVTTTVAAAAPPVAAVTPPATGTPTTIPPAASTSLPPVSSKAPKIPLQTTTPKATTTPTTPTTTTPTTTSGGTGAANGAEETHSNALVLDTNAASTYNPYALPASSFGDPSLSIDGDTSTGWTAQVEPSTAPKMAAGLVLDLKNPQRLATLMLVTSSPGMTIQIYGANGTTPPTSITDPAWVKLTHSMVASKRHERIKLHDSTHAFRYVTVWISKAQASSAGTPEAPGRVSINELELFPAA